MFITVMLLVILRKQVDISLKKVTRWTHPIMCYTVACTCLRLVYSHTQTQTDRQTDRKTDTHTHTHTHIIIIIIMSDSAGVIIQ